MHLPRIWHTPMACFIDLKYNQVILNRLASKILTILHGGNKLCFAKRGSRIPDVQYLNMGAACPKSGKNIR